MIAQAADKPSSRPDDVTAWPSQTQHDDTDKQSSEDTSPYRLHPIADGRPGRGSRLLRTGTTPSMLQV